MSVLKTYGMDTMTAPSLTYRLNGGRLEGKIDGLNAVRQSVFLMLSTERFQYLIYSWDYGVELENMIGKSRDYLKVDIERRIREALMQDDRITGISDFTIDFKEDQAFITFKAYSQFGDFSVERSVSVG